MPFRLLIFLLLCNTGIAAQFYNNYKEYRFVNDFNLALTALKMPDKPLKSPGTTGKVTGAAPDGDSVLMTPLNYTDNYQVWIVEFKPGICNSTGYYTIRNKATGTYLTVYGHEDGVNAGNLRQTGYRAILLPLKRKGSDDIVSSQKWRMSNLDNIYLKNGNYQSVYANAFSGQTEYISLKNYEYEMCSLSSFSFDLTHNHRSIITGIQTQLISGVTPMNSDKSRFRIIPNNPVVLVTPRNITGARCPTVLLRGDRDFNGKVALNVKIDLELNPARTAILMKVYFKAEEPRPDHSATEISFTETIYEAPLGLRIRSIVSDTKYYVNTGSNINEETFIKMPNEFLRYCEVVGDTMGDDISNDNNCDNDTRIGPFYFNKLALIFE